MNRETWDEQQRELRAEGVQQERDELEAAKAEFLTAWTLHGTGPTLEIMLRQFPGHGEELAQFAVRVFEGARR